MTGQTCTDEPAFHKHLTKSKGSFRLGVVKSRQRNSIMNQPDFREIHVTDAKRGKTCFGLASHCLTKWCELWWPIMERNKAKPKRRRNYFCPSIEDHPNSLSVSNSWLIQMQWKKATRSTTRQKFVVSYLHLFLSRFIGKRDPLQWAK